MRKIEIGVGGIKHAAAEFLRTIRAIERKAPVRLRERLQFADMATLLKNLTAERWRLIEHVRQHGPLTTYAVARQLNRNYKNVHSDAKRLLDLGLVEKTEDGRLSVPYQSIVTELRVAA